jgi:hypothetical protein
MHCCRLPSSLELLWIFVDNHEPNADGIIPGLGRQRLRLQAPRIQNCTIVRAPPRCGDPLDSKWAPNEIMDEIMNGLVCARYRRTCSAKNGTIPRDMIRAQRQGIHKGGKVPMNELRAQVAEAVKAKRRMRKATTRTNQAYLKMSRKQHENFLEQERRCKKAWSFHHKICS